MSDRQAAIEALNQAFSYKYHSLAGYIEQADPYVADGQEAALACVKSIAAEDRQETDRLARRLEELEGIPQAGAAEQEAASVNYLAIDYLLGVLLKSLERQLAFYESQSGRFGEPVQGDFDRLTASTRHHTEQIGALMKTRPAGQ